MFGEILLKILLRQRAEFEGWLKFELADRIEEAGYSFVEVEAKGWTREKTDIDFYDSENEIQYSVELKTSNTNWIVKGVESKGQPITKIIPRKHSHPQPF
jgi:hypothetical protein